MNPRKLTFTKNFDSLSLSIMFSETIEVQFYESCKPQSYQFGIVEKKNEEEDLPFVVNLCYNDKTYKLGGFVMLELAKEYCSNMRTETLKQFLINYKN